MERDKTFYRYVFKSKTGYKTRVACPECQEYALQPRLLTGKFRKIVDDAPHWGWTYVGDCQLTLECTWCGEEYYRLCELHRHRAPEDITRI